MDIRKEFGGKLEEALNKAVDANFGVEALKKALHDKVDEMVDKYLGDLKHKLKADVIDLIDGEDDIK